MFTPYMTEDEIQAIAYRDFLEIRMKVKIAFEQFIQNLKLKQGQRRAIHSLIENKTVRTKSRNVWKVSFMNTGYSPGGLFFNICFLYIPLYRGNEVDYLFMNDLNTFKLERISPHFLQRYKERYTEYNHVNLLGLHPALYYMLNNEDRTQTYYLPEKWTEEELKEKCFLVSKQGLSLIKVHDKMLTYITFLDQENLSRYKSMVYEEEMVWQDFTQLSRLKEGNADDLLQRKALYKKLLGNPDSKEILKRMLHRMDRSFGKVGNEEKEIETEMDKAWNEIVKDAEWIEKRWGEVMKEVRPKSLMDAQFEDRSKGLHNKD